MTLPITSARPVKQERRQVRQRGAERGERGPEGDGGEGVERGDMRAKLKRQRSSRNAGPASRNDGLAAISGRRRGGAARPSMPRASGSRCGARSPRRPCRRLRSCRARGQALRAQPVHRAHAEFVAAALRELARAQAGDRGEVGHGQRPVPAAPAAQAASAGQSMARRRPLGTAGPQASQQQGRCVVQRGRGGRLLLPRTGTGSGRAPAPAAPTAARGPRIAPRGPARCRAPGSGCPGAIRNRAGRPASRPRRRRRRRGGRGLRPRVPARRRAPPAPGSAHANGCRARRHSGAATGSAAGRWAGAWAVRRLSAPGPGLSSQPQQQRRRRAHQQEGNADAMELAQPVRHASPAAARSGWPASRARSRSRRRSRPRPARAGRARSAPAGWSPARC